MSLQARLNLAHGGFGKRDPFLVEPVTDFDHGMEAFPGHTFRPSDHGLGISELSAVPVLLQDPPTALNRVVFAVVGRVVEQLNRLADLVSEVDHAFEELGPPAIAFGSVVDFDLQA